MSFVLAPVVPSPRWWPAAVLAIAVEAAVLTGAAWLLARPAPPPPAREEINLDLTTLPPPELPKPPEPEPPKALPPKPEPAKPVSQKMQAKPEMRKPVPPPPVSARTAPPPGLVSSAPSDFAEPPPPAPVEAPPVRSAAKAEAVDLFQAQARAAVQAALRYPNAARVRKLVGQSRIGFDYRDGQASNARIVTSSGYDVLDEAAIAALNNAVLPTPPPDLAGHLLKLTIAVNFSVQP
ncbi:TonB family protein [Telmatospirillum siberiense]|uniref:Energy transducer TonB n=1 Tax=Telmatospirillum siberiense TaxID=382514 RepID=A0A2N3Q0Q3_9PROT|nr:TonB family protein [Telmatospirillum siberiense]PKU26224.1 energy transducer TonB [Telmatospirillum siberiense]